MPWVLWRCWLGGRKGIRPVINWVVGCWRGYLSGVSADLHMAQLMPLPLTVSCFSKIHIGFTFLVPAHLGSPGQRAIKRVCVCVCVAVLSGCISSALEEHGETCWPWAGFLPTGHRSTTAKLTTGQTDTRLVLYAFCYRHAQNNNSMIVVVDYRLWVCQAGEGSHVDAVWHSRVPCTRNYSQQSK